MSITQTKYGTVLKIFVKPNSPEFKISLDEDEIVIYSTEEPVKGRVNREIVKEFSRIFNLKVEIISGLTSKQKVLLLKDANKETAEAIIKRIASTK